VQHSAATTSLTPDATPDLEPAASPHDLTTAAAVRPGVVRSLVETTKPGITKLVTITSFVGFVMSSASHPWSGLTLATAALGVVVGTALAAAGANAINQYMERDRDARMPRTVGRPLPQQRVTPGQVLLTGVSLGVAGCLVLWLLNGLVPSLIALACIVSYIAFYTPMKTRTAMATFVGAIPGALPPLIGWAAGSTSMGWDSLLEWGGISLFALMFVWQIPHFLAIALMYKDDYAKGGYLVLPVVDQGGTWTAATIALWTVTLVPATLMPAIVMPDRLGTAYLSVATLSGIAFLLLAAKLVIGRTRSDARVVFFASIIHLPLILLVMVAETIVGLMVG
jgi:protoheme IX farnesyltransferase